MLVMLFSMEPLWMTATVEPDMATDIAQVRGMIAAEMVYWELELFAFSPLWLKPGVQSQ